MTKPGVSHQECGPSRAAALCCIGFKGPKSKMSPEVQLTAAFYIYVKTIIHVNW